MTVSALIKKATFWSIILFALFPLGIREVRAAPITSISVSYPSTVFDSANSNGASSITLPSLSSAAILFGTSPATSILNGANSLSISLGAFTATSGTGSVSSNLTLTDGSNSAVFSLTSPFTINNPASATGSASFTTQAVLVSNTIPGFDLSQFTIGGGGGTVTFSETGFNFNAGNPGTLNKPGSSQGGFTLTSNQALGLVPEPNSLLLWGAVGMVGVWYGRRKLCPKLAA